MDTLRAITRIVRLDEQSRSAHCARSAGFSTIEIMIALAVMVIALTGVILANYGPQAGSQGVFGLNFENQDILIATQIGADALNEAQEMIEEAQALARKDFNLVVSTTTVAVDPTNGFTFRKEMLVETQSDFLTKKVTARVYWDDARGLEQHTELISFLTNFNRSIGANTCSSELSGDWENPVMQDFQFANLVGDPGGMYTLSDVDAYKGRLYVTASHTSGPTKPTFFVFDITDQENPTFMGDFDNATSVSDGYAAVRVAENLNRNGHRYAYLANGYGADFGTCSQGSNCAQLQILEVEDPDSLAASDLTNYKLPSISGGTQAVGRSIYYVGNYVFLGLDSTDGHGPEFHIVAVGDPENPFEIGRWPNSSMEHAINSVVVHGARAYLATADDDEPELHVLNVANPVNPTEIGTYDAAGGSGSAGNGKSLYAVGDTLYFGRTNIGSASELLVLDNHDPEDIEANNATPLLEKEVGSSVVDLIVRDMLGFFLTTTTSNLEVVSVATGADVASRDIPGLGAGLDCEGNVLYAVSNDGGGNGYLSVITPGT